MFPITTAFSQSDWANKEIREKLYVVTMSKLNKYPLTHYETLLDLIETLLILIETSLNVFQTLLNFIKTLFNMINTL